MTFEKSLETLENIVKELESGELPIEKSIAEFEKGIKLIKECQSLLDKAGEQVTELIGEAKNGEADH